MKRLTISVALLLAVVPPAWPQETPSGQRAPNEAPAVTVVPADLPIVPDTPERTKELVKWVKDAKAWQKWDRQWRSVPEWTWLGNPAGQRRQPEPPAWMAVACDDFNEGRIVATERLVEACDLKKDLARGYDDVIVDRIEQERALQRRQDEALEKSTFLSKLHFDGPYIMAQSDGWRIFSYFGVHFAPF